MKHVKYRQNGLSNLFVELSDQNTLREQLEAFKEFSENPSEADYTTVGAYNVSAENLPEKVKNLYSIIEQIANSPKVDLDKMYVKLVFGRWSPILPFQAISFHAIGSGDPLFDVIVTLNINTDTQNYSVRVEGKDSSAASSESLKDVIKWFNKGRRK